jgi:uncharacterized protein (DUF1697 family)
MAERHVALLRGINVGKAKRVSMADLRALVEDLGYADVKTLLNSGNVVFSARTSRGDHAERIERALTDRLKLSARVTVLSAGELTAAVSKNPLENVALDPSRMLVAVLREPADRARLGDLLKQDWKPDRLALGPRVAYLWCARGLIESKLMEAVGRALGDGVTTRNWTTMTKLLALATEDTGQATRNRRRSAAKR